MALAQEDKIAVPPGFEEYSPDAPSDVIDPSDLQSFVDFMSQKADTNTSDDGSALLAAMGDTRGLGCRRGGKTAQGQSYGSGLVGEQQATVEIKDSDNTADTSLFDLSSNFEDLNLSDALINGIYETGFVKPSKIQACSLPHIVCKGEKLGRNMIGQAQNGSGKTATFALALLSAIDAQLERPQALVICPTRELARQNESVIMQLGKYLPVKTQLVVPSVDRIPRNAPVHVLVGTPGKILDLSKKRVVDVSSLKVLVLDEADMMLDSENQMMPQVTQIKRLITNEDLQVLFFSATYPDDVRTFAEHLVPDPLNIKVRKTELTVSSVVQMYMLCKDENSKCEKLSSLYSAMNVGQSVVFVNARTRAFSLAKWMQNAGFTVSLICGTQSYGEERMDPALRDKVMDEFRRGVTRVLIATDVLSRGIDVPQVTLVVNYELPINFNTRGVDMETYLHRVGRTGRFGLKGISVNLVTNSERSMIDEVCSFFACSISEMDGDFEALEERLKTIR